MGKIVLRAALLVALLAPVALAHGTEDHLDDQLVENGERLLVGRFTGAQEGALIVVPRVEGELGCRPPAEVDHRFEIRLPNASLEASERERLGAPAGISFATNATTFAAYFDVPPAAEGYAGVAIDTHDARRTLILMAENAVALHALAGVVVRGSDLDLRTGALGLPYPIPGVAAHDMGPFTPEGGGVLMDHDDSFPGATACAADERGHFAVHVAIDSLPDSLGPGRLVHAVALYDPTIAEFLPRPLDGTTSLLQANLYLAREGEDAAHVRDALDPRLRAADWLPLAGLALGLVLVARR